MKCFFGMFSWFLE